MRKIRKFVERFQKIEEKPDVNVPHWLSEQDDQKA